MENTIKPAAAAAAVDRNDAMISARGVKTFFPVKTDNPQMKHAMVQAVNGVDLEVGRGEILGIVGESGCGKSTLGRTLLRLERPQEGEILFDGQDVLSLDKQELKAFRKRAQMIFQDPFSSLNPRKRVGALIEQPLRIHGEKDPEARRRRTEEVLEEVGIHPRYRSRFPHQFSGGQRQRIGIARALAADPDFVVCDEAVSALDVSVQAQILNLLLDLRERHNLTYLFISHDLSVVEFIAQRVLVMYLGRIVEEAPTAELVAEPLHPYTQALFSSYPSIDPRKRGVTRTVVQGDVPSPVDPPKGCHFAPRCPFAMDKCRSQYPPEARISPTRKVACWLHADS
jgi:oligopeptide/dipeptide ABC transporter ATP-binding protein